MGTGERREREKQRRREDILEAAKSLFFSKGFRDTTIDDIAKATELARGTIYLYFQSKEEVYATILETGLDTLLNMIEASYDPQTDPLTNLLNGHDAFMRFHDQYPQYYAVLMLDKMQIADVLPTELKERLDSKTQEMAKYIARILQEGINKDYFRPMPVDQVALLQMGISMGFAQMMDKCVQTNADPVDRSVAREVLHDLIANGVLVRRARS
jgi:AcrR family transcriptional regulator